MADDDKKPSDADSAADAAEEAAKDAKDSAQDAQKAEVKAEKAADQAKAESDLAKEAAKEVKEESKEKPSQSSKPKVKVSAKLEKIIEEIEKLSVLELSELVKALEEKFGVSAAPIAAAGPAGQAGGGAEEQAPEQTTFNVILADSGANKISVIKAVREIVPTLGLKEAKDLVDAAPKPVLEGANKESANEAKTKLEAAGAKVELK